MKFLKIEQILNFIYGPYGQNIPHPWQSRWGFFLTILEWENMLQKTFTTASYTLLITLNYSALMRQQGSPGK